MTYAALRKRFGIADQSAAEVSRFLKGAEDDRAIVKERMLVGTQNRTKLPFWLNRLLMR